MLLLRPRIVLILVYGLARGDDGLGREVQKVKVQETQEPGTWGGGGVTRRAQLLMCVLSRSLLLLKCAKMSASS